MLLPFLSKQNQFFVMNNPSLGMLMQSIVLKALKKKHVIIDTPADGNCFYHAFAYVFDLPYETMRLDIARAVTDQDAYLFSSIHGIGYTKEELQDRIIRALDFADHVEIAIAVKLYNVELYIVDDEFGSIFKQFDSDAVQDLEQPVKYAFLLRKGLHYSLSCSRRKQDGQEGQMHYARS